VDTLHLGDYWPVQEGEGRRRRPPARLGVENERGYWEENLPRELSMGDPSSRQLTPHPSPPGPGTDRSGSLDPPDGALEDVPENLFDAQENLSDAPENPFDAPEFQHLPASRTWDADEIFALKLDRAQPPRRNLICITHFCPDMAGEDEPTQMEENRLAAD
jgi:hypothetical protein